MLLLLDLLIFGDLFKKCSVVNIYMVGVIGEVLIQFKVDVVVMGCICGFIVICYEVELGFGVKVEKIIVLQCNIVYVVVIESVCMLVLIFGKFVVGIEVFNIDWEMVWLVDVFIV